jgi:hypothetical protein
LSFNSSIQGIMKKKITFPAILLMAMLFLPVWVSAQASAQNTTGNDAGKGRYYLDKNSDGVCDNNASGTHPGGTCIRNGKRSAGCAYRQQGNACQGRGHAKGRSSGPGRGAGCGKFCYRGGGK